MNDNLGLFDRHGEDETGELNLTELRAALTQTAAAAPPPKPARTAPRREQRVARQKAAKRRKRRVPTLHHRAAGARRHRRSDLCRVQDLAQRLDGDPGLHRDRDHRDGRQGG